MSQPEPLVSPQGLCRFSRSPRLSQVTHPSWVGLKSHAEAGVQGGCTFP